MDSMRAAAIPIIGLHSSNFIIASALVVILFDIEMGPKRLKLISKKKDKQSNATNGRIISQSPDPAGDQSHIVDETRRLETALTILTMVNVAGTMLGNDASVTNAIVCPGSHHSLIRTSLEPILANYVEVGGLRLYWIGIRGEVSHKDLAVHEDLDTLSQCKHGLGRNFKPGASGILGLTPVVVKSIADLIDEPLSYIGIISSALNCIQDTEYCHPYNLWVGYGDSCRGYFKNFATLTTLSLSTNSPGQYKGSTRFPSYQNKCTLRNIWFLMINEGTIYVRTVGKEIHVISSEHWRRNARLVFRKLWEEGVIDSAAVGPNVRSQLPAAEVRQLKKGKPVARRPSDEPCSTIKTHSTLLGLSLSRRCGAAGVIFVIFPLKPPRDYLSPLCALLPAAARASITGIIFIENCSPVLPYLERSPTSVPGAPPLTPPPCFYNDSSNCFLGCLGKGGRLERQLLE
ncbi:hypothetical protein J6590_015583 [Homalodisca vitripennis]|nr:hypothetical protein J6590_015583 [Homalodisca vitripennis]